VSLEWLDPINTASPTELEMRKTRRSTNAFSPVDFQQRAGFQCPGADQSAAAREQVHVASEFSAIESVEDSLALGGNTKHFDPATQYDEDAVMQVSPFQYDFVWLRIPLLTKRCQPSNLTVVKFGEPCFDLFGRSSRYQFTSRHRFFLCVQ
jgi:hypothetical protein